MDRKIRENADRDGRRQRLPEREPADELKEQIRSLPLTPGVYLMKDAQGTVIYIGKSKHLRKRVQSYFHRSGQQTPKVAKLVSHVRSLGHIDTDTEFEALLLECRLIRERKPWYNRLMKSPLSYRYIAVRRAHEPNRLLAAGAADEPELFRYFGPYSGKGMVERALLGIRECFDLQCAGPSASGRPCLNVALGLCNGMCTGGAALEVYHAVADRFALLLSGEDNRLLDDMRLRMEAAAEALDFERAARTRNAIDAVQALLQREKVIGFAEADRFAAVYEELEDGSGKLFLIRGGHLLASCRLPENRTGRKHAADTAAAWLSAHLTAAAEQAAAGAVSRDTVDEAHIVYAYLNGGSCRYVLLQPEKELSHFPDVRPSPSASPALHEAVSSLLSG